MSAKKATVHSIADSKLVAGDDFFTALDAMENLVASLGTQSDPRSHTNYKEKYRMARFELEALYIENWLAGKIVDIIPDDMTREWRTINSTQEPDKVEEFNEFEEELNVVGKFNEATKWGRLYGGAGIILGVDPAQGGQPDTPLDIDRLGKDCLQFLNVIDAERLPYSGGPVVLDPMDPRFGMPEFYTPANSVTRIHHSRILFFEGIPLPYYMRQRQRLAYWGASVLRRCMEAIINSDLGTAGVAALMTESSVDVIKYKGLTSFLSQPGGEEKIRKRFALMKLLKSMNNMTLLDEEESFENHQQAFSGLSDLMEKFLAFVAGAADIPVTRLVGTSAKGMNATGEGDLTNYYDNIRARQKREYNPNLRRLDRIMQRSLWGGEAEEWTFTWDSLFQLTELEQAQRDEHWANRDVAYLNASVIDENIVAGQLYEEGTYTNIDQEFLDKLSEDVAAVNAASAQNKLLAEKEAAALAAGEEETNPLNKALVDDNPDASKPDSTTDGDDLLEI